MTTKIVHLVPKNGIGGVEISTSSLLHANGDNFNYSVEYISLNKSYRVSFYKQFISLFSITFKLIKLNPDVLICSLWKSALVGCILKIIKPNIILVSFLHNSRSQHFFDYIFNKILILVSSHILVDSLATRNSRVNKNLLYKTTIISFLIRKDFSLITESKALPNFIFWGRLHYQKNIKIALKLFLQIKQKYPQANFTIIGPDAGKLSELKLETHRLNLVNNVNFLGPLSYEEICKEAMKHTFYLQTSLYEGMAMSVIEAMQLGLVPIVTPVGEIKSYCKNGANSIVINELNNVLFDVSRVIGEPHLYLKLRNSAIQTWEKKPTYKDDMLIFCEKISKDICCKI